MNTVYQWTNVNNMELHASKFECLRYGTTPICSHHLTTCKSNTGSTITGETSVKELCVQISKDATFKKHIQNVIDSANNQCSWIQITFQTRHAQAMLTLWKSLVLCKLDYCSQLWCPSEKVIFNPWKWSTAPFYASVKDRGISVTDLRIRVHSYEAHTSCGYIVSYPIR